MNVVYPRSDLVGVGKPLERRQQFHVRTRSLDGDHVGIHRCNRLDYIIELAVAHVGMNLGFVAHARSTQAEGLGGPLQVVGPGSVAQRQAFAEGRFVDLHDSGPRRFQVEHLVADRQCQLTRLHFTAHVLARERPHQHGHRAGQHALHHLAGQALGILDPFHGHGLRPAQVTDDHCRLHAARAIALHPAEAGERIAVELLGEVLDHVVALGLAVYQHIQAQILLDLHRMADLAVHGLDIIGLGQLALLVGLARQTDGRSLRKRTNGGGRERWQAELRTLLDDTLGKRRLALAVGGLDGGQAGLYGGLVDARRGSAAGLHGPAMRQGCSDISGLRVVDGPGQQRHFLAFLHGKGQPALQLGIQLVFTGQIHRAVQQRAGRCHPQPLTQAFMGMAQHLQRLLQVAAPDIAAIDQAQ